MRSSRLLVAGLLGCAAVGAVLACGPDFPWQLLDDRVMTLKSTPANDFYYELPKLLTKPGDSLKPVEAYRDTFKVAEYQDDNDEIDASMDAQRTTAEEQGLDTSQLAALHAMRAAADADKAYAAGASLSPAVRQYTAGAVAFHKKDIAHAKERFLAVLALPADECTSRATWAAYMLGRVYAAGDDEADAAKYFAMTRSLALQGQPDPLGLAVASYNEEAGMHYRAAEALVQGGKLPPAEASAFGREMTQAANLYAEAQTRGSVWSWNSLLWLAGEVLAEPVRVEPSASDPFMQRLLVAYVLARVSDEGSGEDFIDWHHPRDAAGGDGKVTLDPSVAALVAALDKHPVSQALGKDNLAALMYRVGRYDLAGQLVADSTTPMAYWVKAKLAIQKGDLAAAAADYSHAVKAFDTTKSGLTDYNATLIQGEDGVLSLARGDYLDAMTKLYEHGDTYWGDVAYLAERVLTVDELKRFVDGHASLPQAAPAGGTQAAVAQAGWVPYGPAVNLRDLLARRLVRAGRFQEALSYFSQPADDWPQHPGAAVVQHAVSDYSKALDAAHDKGASDAQRAQSLYAAALLAKHLGMDMMGTETAPDYYVTGGAFDDGWGQTALGDQYVTDGERKRFSESAIEPDKRFHYRYIALDQIEQAAALVPKHSEAYAALLCTASGWMIHTVGEQERVKELYVQYEKYGALVPWAKAYGSDCPTPDFSETAADVATKEAAITAKHAADRKAYAAQVAAQAAFQKSPYLRARRFVWRHRWAFLSGLGVLLLAGGAIGAWVMLKRRRASRAG